MCSRESRRGESRWNSSVGRGTRRRRKIKKMQESQKLLLGENGSLVYKILCECKSIRQRHRRNRSSCVRGIKSSCGRNRRRRKAAPLVLYRRAVCTRRQAPSSLRIRRRLVSRVFMQQERPFHTRRQLASRVLKRLAPSSSTCRLLASMTLIFFWTQVDS